MDGYLDKIVKCPQCNTNVRYGKMIWLDGECTCPECYNHKRRVKDGLIAEGYNKAKKEFNKEE